MSRRPDIEFSDDEDDFPEQDWETEGSGLMNALGFDQGWKQFNKTSSPGYFSAGFPC